MADGVEYSFAAAKGPMGDGVDAEVMGASAQWKHAGQMNLQASLANGKWTSKDGAFELSAETFGAKANLGFRNADGSKGFNVAAGVTVVGVEGTWKRGADSVTVGLSFGDGVEFSTGVRDIDNDGKEETCRRTSLLFVTLGWCREQDRKTSISP